MRAPTTILTTAALLASVIGMGVPGSAEPNDPPAATKPDSDRPKPKPTVAKSAPAKPEAKPAAKSAAAKPAAAKGDPKAAAKAPAKRADAKAAPAKAPAAKAEAKAPAPKSPAPKAGAKAPAPKGEAKAATTPAAPPSPVPIKSLATAAVTAAEAQHVARFDAAIALAREYTISANDIARLREAIAATGAANLAAARAARDKITDPAAAKLVDWTIFRGGYGTANEVRTFLEANPAWPDRELLARRAEEALFNGTAPAKDIRAFFADVPPRTGVGMAALASALAADKEQADAKALAVKAWTERDIPAGLEPAFLKRMGPFLTEADHKARLDRLLLNDSRWTSERNERAAIIKRVIALLSEPEKKKAQARLAVFMRAKNSGKLLAALPADAQADWGVAFHRAQALRRQKKAEEAWKLLLAEPKQAPMLLKPDGWWEERRAAAYAALRLGKPKLAWDLVRDPGPLAVNASKDAAFFAGWLALRHLNDAKGALPYFEKLAQEADGPLSKSRGHYWLGRVHDALGDKGKAQESYRAATAFFDTFHGQLARLRLNPGSNRLDLKPPAAPTPEQAARFNNLDAVRAAVVVYKVGLGAPLLRSFFIHLRSHLESEAEIAMLAHLAELLGDTQIAVRIGKSAISRGMNLVYYAYPIHSLPAYTPLRTPAETAMILGIARQESEFNQQTASGAGARGILQVMPVTARHVCRDYKIKCDMSRVVKDPVYNTMLGSAYISDRMDEFSGSYVLTLAGYNAGPGRAREWIGEFGDPRDGKIDPIDWIHRIPFEETRDYVQKVLSNIQIYRARLGDAANAVRLEADLKRKAAAAAPAAAPSKPAAAAAAK